MAERDQLLPYLRAAQDVSPDDLPEMAEEMVMEFGPPAGWSFETEKTHKTPLGRGRRPHHVPFLLTDYSTSEERFRSSFFATGAILTLVFQLPAYVAAAVYWGSVPGTLVLVPCLTACWLAAIVALLVGMVAAR